MTEVDAEFRERVAAIDVGKKEVTVCVRVPDGSGGRSKQVRSFSTMTGALHRLADWLIAERVELVGMESTSDYWKPVYFLLEERGLTVWLLNARHVKHLPGRPKTDRLDAEWLAKVLERGMAQPSLVHPREIRELQDLTRYRRSVVRAQTADKQRVEKLLEDAGIKLSSVASDIFGVSGRAMLAALLDGERDPRVLADLAKTRLRLKIPELEQALVGRFSLHHANLIRVMLARIDGAESDLARLESMIDELVEVCSFRDRVDRLDTIPGIGQLAAVELIAEIGVDMTRFPTSGHLVSWARFAPIDQASAGRARKARTGRGNPWLGATVGEAVAGAARTQTFLGARYRRLAHRVGERTAIVAVGNSLLRVVYHLLSDPDAVFVDLGPDHYLTHHQTRRERDLVRQLETITGKTVTLTDRAA